jgi:opacity protein-like surface antigen
MKKVILTAVAVFAFGFANAQSAKFGVKGGLNLSTIGGDTDGYDFQSKAGFNLGGFIALKLSDKITVQPEVLYSMQGTAAKNVVANVGGTNYTADVNFNLSYINVPLMLKYYAAEKFNLEFGPQIGFLTAAKTVTKMGGIESKVDAKQFFEKVDFGLNLGAGYDFTDHVSAGVRYNFGVSNIGKNQAGDNSKIENKVFSLSIGYKF